MTMDYITFDNKTSFGYSDELFDLYCEFICYGIRFNFVDGIIKIGDEKAGFVSLDRTELFISEQHLLKNVNDCWKDDLVEYINKFKQKLGKSRFITCFNSQCIHYFEDMCCRNMSGENIIIDEHGKCSMFFKGVNVMYEEISNDSK